MSKIVNYVYKFVNHKNKIIYIGKTHNIKNRMKQHFEGQGHLPRECYDNVKEIYYIEVDGKTNVDMYETFLINKYKPIYNIEKQFHENINKHNNDFINVEEVEWQRLYFYFNEKGIQIFKSEPKSPYLVNNKYEREKCEILAKYNYYQLLNRKGFYENEIPNILEDNPQLLEYLIKIHKEIIDSNNYIIKYSCFDETVSIEDNSFNYIAFDIDKIKNIDIKLLLIMEQSKMIVRLTPQIYGLVAHTKYAFSQFKKHYAYNDFEI